jgi:membrane protease YdiL (CAAX protease family)
VRAEEVRKNEIPASNIRKDVLALILLVPATSIGAFVGLVHPKGHVGQILYAACKVWIALFPLVWFVWVEKGRVRFSKPKRGLALGAALGAVVAAAIFGAYFGFAGGWIDAAEVRALATDKGLAEKALFIPMAFYWVLANSLLEEYVWRWFVFGRCRRIALRLGLPVAVAIAASALFFTFHHVIAMGALFDWRITALGCTGVFVGGVVWAWLYQRFESIWPCWLSHILADVPIFIIGWQLIFR